MFSILKNASFALLGNLLSLPFQFIGFILIARSLGPVEFGKYAFAQEYTLLVVYVADMGLNVIASRELAKHRREAPLYLANMFFLKLVVSLICYSCLVFFGYFLSQNPVTFQALCILGIGNLMLSFLIFCWGIFRAFEVMQWESITGLLQPFFFLTFVLSVIYLFQGGDSVLAMSLARLFSFLPAIGVALIIIFFKISRVEWRLDLRLCRSFIEQGLPIAAAMILYDLLLRICIMALQAWSPAVEVSMFTVASRLTYNLGIIPFVLAGAWMPVLARTALADDEAFLFQANKFNRMLLLSSIPMAGMMVSLADPVVRLLYGPQYVQAIPVLKVLSLSLIPLFLFFGAKTIIESLMLQRLFLGMVAAVSLISGVLTILLIPGYGAMGAAVTYLLAMSSLTAICVFFVRRRFDWRLLSLAALRIVISMLAMVVTIELLVNTTWIGAALAGGLVNILLLFLLRELSLERIRDYVGILLARENGPRD